jgi:glycosyltransferase involved in cell wall biosynthesis
MVTHDRLAYWLKGETLQNFGDYLGEFLAATLFLVFDEASVLRLSGSVIDDGLIPPNLAKNDQFDLSQRRVSFWGCGIRTRGGLMLANKAHIDLFAVRGPVSASELRLGQNVPTGDPALLLPALYSPKACPQLEGKSICIPHFNDKRSDQELLSLAKGDAIIRTEIQNNQAAFLHIVDAVASASFVLSASLHGAIVAAAYGRPFAFWDNGHVDLPTKWEDFASYANIEMHGFQKVSEAKDYYKRKIQSQLKIPSLWPLLANAPCQLNPVAMLRILRYELMREGSIEASRALDPKIDTFFSNANHFSLLAERTRIYSKRRLEAVSETLAEKSSELSELKTETERRSQQSRIQIEELQERIAIYADRVVELTRVIETSDARALESAQGLHELRKRVNEANECLKDERRKFAMKELELEARLTESSRQLSLALEARIAAEVDTSRLTSELSRVIETSGARTLEAAQELQELRKRFDETSESLNDERLIFASRQREFEMRLTEISRELSLAHEARLAAEADRSRLTAELSRVIETSNARSLESAQELEEIRKRFDETNESLNDERRNWASERLEFEARLNEKSRQLIWAQDARIAAEANTSALAAELTGNTPALVAAKRLVRRYLKPDSAQVCAGEESVGLPDQISALDRQLEVEQERYQAALDAAEMALAKTVETGWLVEQAMTDAKNARDDAGRAQAAQAELMGALSESRSQSDKICASLNRSEYELFLERHAKRAADARILRLEREMVARAQTAISSRNLFDRLSGRRAERKLLADQVRQIAEYVDLFDAGKVMAPDPSERNARIVQFLLSASDSLPDLPFFDVPTYIRMYRDTIPSGVNPLIHYLNCAPEVKQRPHVLFDTGFYQEHYPDTGTSNLDPFAHYVKWGADKGYNPHPIFDTRYYFARYPDVAANRINPLAHYLRYPGCCPHPLFDTEYYIRQRPIMNYPGQTPLEHYLTEGALAGLDPHPWFASRFYLEKYTDVAAAGVNPLVHYLTYGAWEGRDPHPEFSTQAYLHAHPALRQSGVNPLVHRVTEGDSLIADSSVPPSSIPTDAIDALMTNEVDSQTSPRRRIVLMVDAYYPRPDNDSGSLDQVAFVRVFQALGYEVHFAADLELGAETPYREQLTALGVKCVTYPQYLSIKDYLARHPEEVAIGFLSRVHFGSRHAETIRQFCPQAVVIFNTVDLHHVREQREAELKGNSEGIARAHETYCAEAAATRDADATIVVSQREAAYWQNEVPEGKVFMVPLLRDYRVGRDTEFEGRSAIAFIGGFSHMPNVDAVEHFLDEIWPLVHAKMPDVEFQVIGANLPDTLAARADKGVNFIGYVEDLERHLAGLRLTVAPLRYGAGAKGKVVTSLAYGVPCVVSSIASEGMGLTDGVNVAVADTPKEFAEKIVGLYQNRDTWTAQSDNGIDLIRDRHSIDRGISLMRNIIQSAERSSSDERKVA